MAETATPELDSKLKWRAHAGEFAWPTLALFATIVAGEVLVWHEVLAHRLPMWAGTIAATLLAYASFTVLHEAVHGNIHGSHVRWRWINELAGQVSAVPLFAPSSMFRVIHLQHHSTTNDPERDPDYWVRGDNVFVVLARCMTILFSYEASFFFGSVSKTKAGREYRAYGVVSLLVLLGTVALLVALGFGREALWLWVVPALLADTFLAFSFDWVPHHPHNVRKRFLDTRIILMPGLTLPMLWQNYHLIHHLYPRVPFYRYAACFRDVRPELEERGSPIVSVFRG